MNIPDKPKPPLTRIITEGTYGTCPICKSTEIKRFVFFGRSIGCIQPECERYYLKNEQPR
jgi:ssDNA-binding Zn-finger/Zn-ribbon topoisomerase 1